MNTTLTTYRCPVCRKLTAEDKSLFVCMFCHNLVHGEEE